MARKAHLIAMAHATVRVHTQRGSAVMAHSRRTNGQHIADIFQRDLDRVLEQLDREDFTAPAPSTDGTCSHPDWYPVRHVDGTRILAYACTDCAASRSA